MERKSTLRMQDKDPYLFVQKLHIRFILIFGVSNELNIRIVYKLLSLQIHTCNPFLDAKPASFDWLQHYILYLVSDMRQIVSNKIGNVMTDNSISDIMIPIIQYNQ